MRVLFDQKVRATAMLVYVSVIGALFAVGGVVVAIAVGNAAPALGGLFLGSFLVVGNLFLAGSMRVVVDEAQITCSVLLARYAIALDDVVSFELAELPRVVLAWRGFPARELGDGRLILRASGRRGVELALRDGRRVFVEAAPPEALAGVLREALATRLRQKV